MAEYSNEEFNLQYMKLYSSIIKDGVPKKNHAVIFLGSQPGAGKSNFYTQDNNLNGYIVIDGDKYRQFHPRYNEIISYDMDNYVERTQGFVNQCIEQLIDDLSDHGYNLIIEGTLRDPDIPINTSRKLNSKGYTSDMYVIGASAIDSWKSTINRAHIMESLGETPRLVPIDKYNYIVNHLPENLEKIKESGCFRSIQIIDRNNSVLYSNSMSVSIRHFMDDILDLSEWNKQFNDLATDFMQEKIDVIEGQIARNRHAR